MRHLFIVLSIFSFGSMAMAATSDDLAGRVVANVDGTSFTLPMLDSAVDVQIEGDMATVEITQRFLNEANVPVEAEYLFPLNKLAAVYAMEMRVGDEIIQAKIRKKEQAKAEFEQAAQDGKAAALLTQHRPNMFTQRIAKIPPPPNRNPMNRNPTRKTPGLSAPSRPTRRLPVWICPTISLRNACRSR